MCSLHDVSIKTDFDNKRYWLLFKKLSTTERAESIFFSLVTCESSKVFDQLDLNWVPVTPLSIASMDSSISTSKGAVLENWECEC